MVDFMILLAAISVFCSGLFTLGLIFGFRIRRWLDSDVADEVWKDN